MPTVSWTIHTLASGTITADALTADWPNLGRGDREPVRFRFDTTGYDQEQLWVPSGTSETIASATTVTTEHVIVDGALTVNGNLNAGEVRADNGTLTVDSGSLTVDDSNRGYLTVAEYGNYPSAPKTAVDNDALPTYRERLPDRAAVDSLVLGLEPPDDLRDRGIRGLWGLVLGTTDNRNPTLTNAELELELYVLGEYREYADVAAVASDLEA